MTVAFRMACDGGGFTFSAQGKIPRKAQFVYNHRISATRVCGCHGPGSKTSSGSGQMRTGPLVAPAPIDSERPGQRFFKAGTANNSSGNAPKRASNRVLV